MKNPRLTGHPFRTAVSAASLLLALVLAGCATPTSPKDASPTLKYGAFLCLQDQVSGEWTSECLNRSTASPTQVRERVAYYNDVFYKNQAQMSCSRRKLTGTVKMIWDCNRYGGRAGLSGIDQQTFEDWRRRSEL